MKKIIGYLMIIIGVSLLAAVQLKYAHITNSTEAFGLLIILFIGGIILIKD
jgi:hypothetical protein